MLYFSDVGSQKKTSALIGLSTGSWTNCPFPKALAMLINQIIEARVLPGQDFTVFLWMNWVFPFCFYFLTVQSTSRVHSHNEWGGKLIPSGLQLFALPRDTRDIYGFPLLCYSSALLKDCTINREACFAKFISVFVTFNINRDVSLKWVNWESGWNYSL